MKKIFKWTGIIILALISGVAITAATRQHLKYKAPYPAIKASTEIAVIERGKHLIFDIAHCADCHSKANADSLIALGLDVPLTGGKVFTLPVGKVYTKNLTPDKETGIGNYTDAEIARALRYSVHPDGTAVYNFMSLHNVSDEDLTAIISYLRAQKPVRNEVPKHSLNLLGNLVTAFMVKPVGPKGEVAHAVQPDTTATYGRYLVNNLANCGGCHTKRDMSGALVGNELAGGSIMKAGTRKVIPPNLTPDVTSRLHGWTQEMFISRFRMGKLIPKSPMPWNTFKRMSDAELKAIYNYLKTVKPAKSLSG